MGVWIETMRAKMSRLIFASHPSWVCGLKHSTPLWLQAVYRVTPFVGVWIETILCVWLITILVVTPFVGVWIETSIIER